MPAKILAKKKVAAGVRPKMAGGKAFELKYFNPNAVNMIFMF